MGSDISNARLATNAGIKYKLMEGYPKIGVTDEEITATEQYLIQMANVDAFILEAMPPPTILGNLILRSPRRRMPGASFLVTQSLQIEPHSGLTPGDPWGADPNAPANTYDDLARVTIEYTSAAAEGEDEEDPGGGDPETFLEHSFTSGAEFLTVSPRKVKLPEQDIELNDNQLGPTDPAILDAPENKEPALAFIQTLPVIEHNLRWKLVLRPWWQQIFNTLGKVNDKRLKLFFNSPQQTVMFSGLSGNRTYTIGAGRVRVSAWSLDFKFAQKWLQKGPLSALLSIGWNHVYVPGDGGLPGAWKLAVLDDEGTLPHLPADLLKLFQADPTP